MLKNKSLPASVSLQCDNCFDGLLIGLLSNSSSPASLHQNNRSSESLILNNGQSPPGKSLNLDDLLHCCQVLFSSPVTLPRCLNGYSCQLATLQFYQPPSGSESSPDRLDEDGRVVSLASELFGTKLSRFLYGQKSEIIEKKFNLFLFLFSDI
jgi:hypothetical protein